TGNLTTLVDRGEPGAADDLTYNVTWRRDFATNIQRPERIEAHDGTGALLRSRQSTYRDNGTVATITDVVSGGKDPNGTAYTGTTDRNLSWQLFYDDFGNLATIIDPTSFTLAYEYDARMHQFAVGVTDTFGYRSTSVPDYRFGLVAERSDVNGQKMQQVFDEFGRLVQIFGPNDIGSSVPTV